MDPCRARIPATALATILGLSVNWRIGSIEVSGKESPDW
jgi:hypothetical protein